MAKTPLTPAENAMLLVVILGMSLWGAAMGMMWRDVSRGREELDAVRREMIDQIIENRRIAQGIDVKLDDMIRQGATTRTGEPK